MAGRVFSGTGAISDLIEKHYDPVFADTLDRNAVLWNMLEKEPCKGTIYWKAHYAGNTTVGSYAEGDTATGAGYQAYEEPYLAPKYSKVEVQISGPAEAVSAAGGTLIDVVQDEFEQGMADLVDDMVDQLYSDGTGNSSADITGLAAGIDDGSNVATYAALARGTYAWWKSVYVHNNGTARALDLPLMHTCYRLQRKVRGKPDLIITHPDHASQYEALLQPVTSLRSTPTDSGRGEAIGIGATQLYFKNIPIVDDDGCPEGKMYFLDRRWIKYRVLKQFEVMEMARTTDATSFWIKHYGNLQVKDPKKQAVIVDLQAES